MASTNSNSMAFNFSHTTVNKCVFNLNDEESFSDIISQQSIPYALLIHGPVKDKVLISYMNKCIKLSKPIQNVHLVGKGVNAKDCTESILESFLSTITKLGGKVIITEASESRKVRYPATVKGDVGDAIRKTYLYQSFSMMGNGGYSFSLVIRINGANVTVLKDALKSVIEQLDYSKINKEVWGHATASASQYLEWLKKNDLQALGNNINKEIGPVIKIIKSMYPYLEDDISSDISDILSQETTPTDILLIISSLKFAILMKLSGMVEIYRNGKGFTIPAKDKFEHLFNDNVIYPEAIIRFNKTLKKLKNLDLTPCYDLYDMLKFEKEFTNTTKTTKELIMESLIVENPELVDMKNSIIDIITDFGEEIDDETRDLSIKRRWKNCVIRECVTSGNMKSHLRLARWLEIVLNN